MLPLDEARKFHGFLRTAGLREGARIEGTVDEICATLGAIGLHVVCEPVEDGPPGTDYLGVLRTLGSPWLEVTEPPGQGILTRDLLQEISRRMGRLTFLFQYAFDQQRLRHRLYANGEPIEELDASAPGQNGAVVFRSTRTSSPSSADVAADVPAYIRLLFRTLRMRDWGVGVAELASLTVPFPPPLIVECYFLRIT